MADKINENKWLTAFFESMREATPEPSSDLMARVLADAEATQAAFTVPGQVTEPARRGRLRQIYDILGGWPAIAGLATATAAGVWIGAYQPGNLADTAQVYLGGDVSAYALDLMPGTEFDFGEEAS